MGKNNHLSEVQDAIQSECDEMAEFLIAKNKAYGNSALDPCRIFSKSSPVEQILVRIDDKLNRLMQGGDYPGDDDVKDLIGYLVLLRVAKRRGGD